MERCDCFESETFEVAEQREDWKVVYVYAMCEVVQRCEDVARIS